MALALSWPKQWLTGSLAHLAIMASRRLHILHIYSLDGSTSCGQGQEERHVSVVFEIQQQFGLNKLKYLIKLIECMVI